MRAVLLAAGVGNRLQEFGARPKSLLEFGGKTLLQRHLENLAANDVRTIDICVGYRAEDITVAANLPGCDIRCRTNERFRRGSVVSLWTMRDVLTSGDEVILMDADVLYTPRILQRLVKSPHANCFLLDENFVPGDEPVKICVADGKIIEFRKQIEDGLRFDLWGESVGFFKFSATCAAALAEGCAQYLASGRDDSPYEEVIRDLILSARFPLGFERVGGMPWIEIDFPEDIARANSSILPNIGNTHD